MLVSVGCGCRVLLLFDMCCLLWLLFVVVRRRLRCAVIRYCFSLWFVVVCYWCVVCVVVRC